jgi:hypothetical protein
MLKGHHQHQHQHHQQQQQQHPKDNIAANLNSGVSDEADGSYYGQVNGNQYNHDGNIIDNGQGGSTVAIGINEDGSVVISNSSKDNTGTAAYDDGVGGAAGGAVSEGQHLSQHSYAGVPVGGDAVHANISNTNFNSGVNNISISNSNSISGNTRDNGQSNDASQLPSVDRLGAYNSTSLVDYVIPTVVHTDRGGEGAFVSMPGPAFNLHCAVVHSSCSFTNIH